MKNMKHPAVKCVLLTSIIGQLLTIDGFCSELSDDPTKRQFIEEKGDNIEFKKIYNKALQLRFQKKGKAMWDFVSPNFKKDDRFKEWLDTRPYGERTQLANAMASTYLEVGGKEVDISKDISFLALRDFVEPTNWSWKHSSDLSGAKITLGTKEKRTQLVVVKEDRKKIAMGSAVIIESYAFEGNSVPDASVLEECLKRNSVYSNSKWVIQTSKSSDGTPKIHLILRATCSPDLDSNDVKALIGDIALTADAFEQDFFKEDKL